MQVFARVNIKPRTLTGYRAVIASLMGAAFTAVCAQVAFHLPGNPIPFTMQVFAVLCCGMVLGSKYGALSQIEYLVAGLCGAPIFADFKAGPIAFQGPTGGYLIGFIAAAFVMGYLMERVVDHTFFAMCLAGAVGVWTIYTCGAAWLAVWIQLFGRIFQGYSFPGWSSWMLGIAPFVGIDAVKVIIAARICAGKR